MLWEVLLLVDQLGEVVVVLQVSLEAGDSAVRVLAAAHVGPLGGQGENLPSRI